MLSIDRNAWAIISPFFDNAVVAAEEFRRFRLPSLFDSEVTHPADTELLLQHEPAAPGDGSLHIGSTIPFSGFLPSTGTKVAQLGPQARVGVYEIAMLLGGGGMGTVYKARDTRLGRAVALKVLSEDLLADPRAREYLEREARVIASLNHPHICTLYDVGHDGDLDYLVLEFLDGETLRDQLDRGAFGLADVVRYGVEIADALADAHRCGVLHGDLKPANIMVTAKGAKVLDFGLAKPVRFGSAVDDGTWFSVASAAPIGGTLPYMAPEQVMGQPADARSDIFAFGALLYEMATGERAFAGATRVSLLTEILRCDPATASITGRGAAAVRRIITKCLARDPEARWQRFEDIIAALEVARTQVSGSRSDRRVQAQSIGAVCG